jgi:uncharacterized protein (DUF1800 family)
MNITPKRLDKRKRRSTLGTLAWLCVLQLVFASSASFAQSSQMPWLNQQMNLADARHLLGRTGFGASPEQLYRYINMNRRQAVQAIVNGLNTTPAVAMPDWVNNPATLYWTRRYMDNSERQEFNASRDREISDLRQWWVSNILQTDSPQTERLVLFWHDHFATSYSDIGQRSIAMARQNQLFRQYTQGSYRDFLKAIIRDPAMLAYLDNKSNRKQKPNENLARELLELFTLGEGNYTESTVKQAARALTGHSFSDVNNVQYRFDTNKHDEGAKTLFGVTQKHNGDSLIDVILEQPAAAEFLVTKFWSAFISDSAPSQEFVTTQSNAFRDSDYNLLQLYISVLSSAEFWSQDNRLSIIKSPATLLLGTARSLEFPKQNWFQMPALLSVAGMTLFSPPNVAGWSEGEAFVAPGRLLNRQIALDTLLSNSKQGSAAGNMMMANDSTNMRSSQNNEMLSSRNSDLGESGLQVRMAAHLYLGAPLYKVELLKHNKILWTSDVHELSVGYDTERFGEMQDENELSWKFAEFQPSATALSDATHVAVHFLNDAAGKNGDRNLFVDGVQVNGQWHTASGAEQQSACKPQNRRNAGNLYCKGKVTIPVSSDAAAKQALRSEYSASDVSLWWKKIRKNKSQLIAVYQDVQTPERYIHNLTVHLQWLGKNKVSLQLNTDGCLPDCVEEWPECSWFNRQYPEHRSLSFPITSTSDRTVNCHYESLSPADKALIDSLWVSVPNMLTHIANKHYPTGKEVKLDALRKQVSSLRGLLETSRYAKHGRIIDINAQYKPDEPGISPVPAPIVSLSGIDAFENALAAAQLSIPELLIGGLEVSAFPDLQNLRDENFNVQLQRLIKHPVYQVY